MKLMKMFAAREQRPREADDDRLCQEKQRREADERLAEIKAAGPRQGCSTRRR